MKMKNFPIALQVYSVRDFAESDLAATLKSIKEMGYDGVEFAGLYGNKPEDIKNLCNEVGLVPISAHVSFTDMIKEPEKVLKEYAGIGCQYVAIPFLTEEYRPGNEKFGEIIEGAKLLGGIASGLGMTLLYHNHDFEFIKINGEYALDILYKEVPADVLKTEIDTCWVNVGGENPSDYILKYKGRAPVVHIKDFTGKKAENMYALIGIDEDEDKSAPAGEFEFRPVGYGLQDVAKILNAAEEAGTEWIVVEQDSPSEGKTQMECAELSINYLKKLL